MSQTEERVINEDSQKIDVLIIIQDFLKVLRRMWIPIVALALIGTVLMGVYANYSYTAYYTASSTFTVNIREEQGSSTSSASSYYNNSAAEQMATTFPYILTSGVLQRKVASELGVSSISGSISASVVDNTNLLTISVCDTDPERAYETLQVVIDNYPSVSEFIIGKVNLRLLDETGIPTSPDNEKNITQTAGKGTVVGTAIGFLWAVLVTLFRRTIRREDDILRYVNQRCVGSVPYVHMKERSKKTERYLRITDENIDPEFKESIRIIRNKVDRYAKENAMKKILVTSALAGEGKSTIAVNLAMSLAQEGKKVILIDCDLRNPSDSAILDVESEKGLVDYLKKEARFGECVYSTDQLGIKGNMKFLFIPGGKPVEDGSELLGRPRMKKLVDELSDQIDYVILDCAPVGLLTDAGVLAEYADGALFIVKKDFASAEHILNGMEHLAESNIQMIGCVLNGE